MLCGKSLGQAVIIEEEFNGGTTAPSGWSFTSIGSTISSNSNYGKSAPSVVMDATNDQITSSVFTAGTANTISFWAQSTSGTPSASDIITVEYFNGSWNSCSPATFTFNTTARMFEAAFPLTATRVRITYTKSGVNVAIDDFTVLNKTVPCTTASFLWFSSIVYNSCNANTCEGTDEFLSFQNGSAALNLSDLEITVPGAGAGPEGTTFCGNSSTPCDEYFTTNAAYVTSLNTAAGCAGFFLSPPASVIPANGRVIVFMGSPPSATINFSNLCSSGGNYYCVFVSNTSNCTGRYSNSATTPRYTTIRNRNTGCSVERSFTPSLGGSSDGDLVAFDPTGTASYLSNPGCSGFAVLPVELAGFWGEVVPGGIRLKWSMASEEPNTRYIIEKSSDAQNWRNLTDVVSDPSGHTNGIYSVTDDAPLEGANYYRFSSSKEGVARSHEIILVDFKNKSNLLIISQTENELAVKCPPGQAETTLSFYDLVGQLLKQVSINPAQNGTIAISKEGLPKGMLLVVSGAKNNGSCSKIIID